MLKRLSTFLLLLTATATFAQEKAFPTILPQPTSALPFQQRTQCGGSWAQGWGSCTPGLQNRLKHHPSAHTGRATSFFPFQLFSFYFFIIRIPFLFFFLKPRNLYLFLLTLEQASGVLKLTRRPLCVPKRKSIVFCFFRSRSQRLRAF